MSAPANDHRRDTPLLGVLRQEIVRTGPLPINTYMEQCLRHPEHGYYSAQRVIGSSGDFITAPEISQIFGELIGLWCAVVWNAMGSPAAVDVLEIGPGRGTLMSDALRAVRKVPGLTDALRVHLIEVSPVLGTLQKAKLATTDVPVEWHEAVSAIEPGTPRIVIANEYLDTLPVAQFIVTETGPMERAVAVDNEGQLNFTVDQQSDIPEVVRDRLAGMPAGTIAEMPAHNFDFLTQICRNGDAPVAALFIDYGHDDAGTGETLQAVRAHQFEHVLTSPGEADLSVQVDFQALVAASSLNGLEIQGPIPQAEFLGQLGMLDRASRLMNANPEQAGEIEAGVLRLMAPNGMGTRFKAIALKSPDLPELPGFATVAS